MLPITSICRPMKWVFFGWKRELFGEKITFRFNQLFKRETHLGSERPGFDRENGFINQVLRILEHLSCHTSIETKHLSVQWESAKNGRKGNNWIRWREQCKLKISFLPCPYSCYVTSHLAFFSIRRILSSLCSARLISSHLITSIRSKRRVFNIYATLVLKSFIYSIIVKISYQ